MFKLCLRNIARGWVGVGQLVASSSRKGGLGTAPDARDPTCLVYFGWFLDAALFLWPHLTLSVVQVFIFVIWDPCKVSYLKFWSRRRVRIQICLFYISFRSGVTHIRSEHGFPNGSTCWAVVSHQMFWQKGLIKKFTACFIDHRSVFWKLSSRCQSVASPLKTVSRWCHPDANFGQQLETQKLVLQL